MRTLAWLYRFRRRTVRLERRADIHGAFLALSGAIPMSLDRCKGSIRQHVQAQAKAV
jgi:hypothetical protein